MDIAYITWPISDGWSYVSAVCAHTHTRTYTRARTHIHTDYIDRSFFLFPLSLSRTNMHTRHKSLGLSVDPSVGWRKLDAKEAAFELRPKKMVYASHVKNRWTLPPEQTQELFEKLLTDPKLKWTVWKWKSEDIWIRPGADETQFRLKKGGDSCGQPQPQNKMTQQLKDGLKRHGYVTDGMLKNGVCSVFTKKDLEGSSRLLSLPPHPSPGRTGAAAQALQQQQALAQQQQQAQALQQQAQVRLSL